jgi:hypothetical protein
MINGYRKSGKDWHNDSFEKLYTEHEGIIIYKGRICIGDYGQWRDKLLQEMYDFSLGVILVY